MLVGGSGQGKTKFLDFLANLGNIHGVKSIKDCREFHKVSAECLTGGISTSKTSSSVKYAIKIGHAEFTIIDTPGFGDTRGLKQDELNYENMKQAVLDEGGINCICVV